MVGIGISVVSVVGISVSVVGKTVSIAGVGKAISVDTIVSIGISLSLGGSLSGGSSLSISGPPAVVVSLVGIGVAVVSQAITVAMVGIAEVVAIAIVAIESIGISLSISLSRHGCEHAESGNGHGFHGDVIKLEELAGLPM